MKFTNKTESLTCPFCVGTGTGIENTLHLGTMRYYYCHDSGNIGWYKNSLNKDKNNDKKIRS